MQLVLPVHYDLLRYFDNTSGGRDLPGFGEAIGWYKAGVLVYERDEKQLRYLSLPRQQSVSSSGPGAVLAKVSRYSAPGVKPISGWNRHEVGISRTGERIATLFDGLWMGTLSGKLLWYIPPHKLARMSGVSDVGQVINFARGMVWNEAGDAVAFCLASQEWDGTAAPYGDTFVADIRQQTVRRIGVGAPRAWLGNAIVLERVNDFRDEQNPMRADIYSPTGRLLYSFRKIAAVCRSHDAVFFLYSNPAPSVHAEQWLAGTNRTRQVQTITPLPLSSSLTPQSWILARG